jgi:hypothetical protein
LFVALVALHGSVSPKKRETILVILHLLDSDVPALDGMTLGTIGAHLAPMNVGVTIGTVLADIGEHGLDVTFSAFHFFMQAAQWIVGLVVIEFRNSPNRTPTGGRMTIFTRNAERAVGVTGGFFLGINSVEASEMGGDSRRRAGGREGEERPERELE